MTHPYSDLPPEAFWRSAVVEADRRRFPALYRPRVAIARQTAVATVGSCFAQHIARALRGAGCTVLDGEPRPRNMPADIAEAFGYGRFSGRYGNIYTARQLRQLLDEIIGGEPDPSCLWIRQDGRFADAFRPTLEPDGMDSAEEVMLLRAYHLERTSRMLMKADVMILTLGLTEAWEDTETGRIYPLCPGVAGGRFDPARHRFVNFRQAQVLEDLAAIHAALQRFRAGMQMVLTVSPVPLTATASGQHVLTATAGAKAVLRAAAGEFVAGTPGTDYFPSFELVTNPAAGGPWFESNLRSVSADGVARVMEVFLTAQGLATTPDQPRLPEDGDEDEDEDDITSAAEDLVCDELLLDAFRK